MTLRLRALSGLAALALLTGCYAFYEHRISRPNASIYGDHDLPRLESTADFIERAMAAFRELFGSSGKNVPPPRVVFEVDALSQQHVYLPQPRQEGYYLPLFGLVHLSPQIVESASSDTSRRLDEVDAARIVSLHELSHHFLISIHPESNSMYWLNEGFACVMETARISDEGHLVIPAFHPWLHRRARLALLNELGREGLIREMERLLDASWMSFHRGGDKTRNYALSYAMVRYWLHRLEGSFETRVARLIAMPNEELLGALPGLIREISRPPAFQLARLARFPEHRAWALRQWVEVGAFDLEPLVAEIHRSLASPSATERLLGCRLGTELLRLRARRSSRHLDALDRALAHRLGNSTSEEQRAIADGVTPSGIHSPYWTALVAHLESEDEPLRVASAAALARASVKPTIARPAFWRGPMTEDRWSEIDEWKEWCAARPIAKPDLGRGVLSERPATLRAPLGTVPRSSR